MSARSSIISSQPARIWQCAHPVRMVRNLWKHRELLRQFMFREVRSRYRGSYLGILWSLITPLLMLIVYTTVFTMIFSARWPGAEAGGPFGFAIIIFSGLIAFNLFSECVGRMPDLIVGRSSYVKKVVFPLEILPVSILGSALLHSLISLSLVLIFQLILFGRLPWTLVYLPLVYLPLIAFTLGISWLLACLGVFIRDLSNFIGVAIHLLFFMTPIVYPASAVPAELRFLLWVNPLALLVEDFRRVFVWGLAPDWPLWAASGLVSVAAALAGYACFMKLKGDFADAV